MKSAHTILARNNLFIPKKIAEYDDLSFLFPENLGQLLDKIANLSLTEEEIEAKNSSWKMI